MLIEREAISYDSPLGSAVTFGEFRDEGFDLGEDSDGLIGVTSHQNISR